MKLERAWEKLVFYFVCYSLLGWCYEVFLEVVVYRWGFSNRGFLFGPYCPVYGFGALLLLACLGPLMRKKLRLGGWNITPVLVFLGVMAITTAVELIASYLLEAATGSWLWDYRSYSFQFQGRIALNPSFRFGIGGMVILYGIHPLLKKLTDRIGKRRMKKIGGFLAAVLAADFLLTVLIRL